MFSCLVLLQGACTPFTTRPCWAHTRTVLPTNGRPGSYVEKTLHENLVRNENPKTHIPCDTSCAGLAHVAGHRFPDSENHSLLRSDRCRVSAVCRASTIRLPSPHASSMVLWSETQHHAQAKDSRLDFHRHRGGTMGIPIPCVSGPNGVIYHVPQLSHTACPSTAGEEVLH